MPGFGSVNIDHLDWMLYSSTLMFGIGKALIFWLENKWSDWFDLRRVEVLTILPGVEFVFNDDMKGLCHTDWIELPVKSIL